MGIVRFSVRYIGGKFRVKNDLHRFFNSFCKDKVFVDLFCGSCNVIEGVNAKERIANDNNHYLIEMFKDIQNGSFTPPPNN